MVIIKKDYIRINQYTRAGYKLYKVLGIVIHWTANYGASAKNHHDYFNGNAITSKRYTSAQTFVDDKEIIEIMPLNEVAFACNETGHSKIAKFNGNYGYTGGNANGCTINIEMCVDANGHITEKTFKNTVYIATKYCKKYNLSYKDIYRHYDITGKNCPAPWVSKPSEFTRFKKAVKKSLEGSTDNSNKSVGKTSPKTTKGYTGTIKVLVNDLNYYSTARWTKPSGTVNKNTILTVEKKVLVDGAYMYKLKSGNYITASSKYVKFTKK